MAEKKVESLYAVFLHDGDGPVPVEDLPRTADDIFDISAHYYAIYAVSVPDVVDDDDDDDADAGSSPPPPPEKRLKSSSLLHPLATLSLGDFPSSMSFACLGSCIYMFGGWIWKDNLCSAQPPRSSYYSSRVSPSFDVYIIDTANLTLKPKPGLKPGDLKEGPPLNNLNDVAFSVSLLGKIFAIPPSFDFDDECAEFLDPSSHPNQWHCIPNPKVNPLSPAHVNRCTVVGSYILVQLYDGPAYQLDATNPERGWKLSTGSRRTQMFTTGSVSEVVDGLLCTWQPVHHLDRDTCFKACSLADLAKFDEFVACIFPDLGNKWDDNSASLRKPRKIAVCHPSGCRMGGEIVGGHRKVIDIGDGRAAIVTGGFTRAQPLELHFILDIVRLEKSEECTPRVEIIPLKSIDHVIEIEIGKPNSKFFNICGFFPMMGGAGSTQTSAAAYSDIVLCSRRYKLWDNRDRKGFPFPMINRGLDLD